MTDQMTDQQITRILASLPRDAGARRLHRSAEFTAWERGLRSQIADAEGPQVEWSRDDLPGIKRLLARLLETKAREAKRK